MNEIQFILFVSNQEKSTCFYRHLFNRIPYKLVDGLTEFQLLPGVKLGLMSEKGAAKIIDDQLPNPSEANGIPRCEIYLKVFNAEKYLQRAMELGADLISEFALRDWGAMVGYLSDLDGHIIAFAEE